MGVFCIILGTILAVACCAGGVILGYVMDNSIVMGQPAYQFFLSILNIKSPLMSWVVCIGFGLVLALLIGVPLIAGGNMYCKGARALRKAKKMARSH